MALSACVDIAVPFLELHLYIVERNSIAEPAGPVHAIVTSIAVIVAKGRGGVASRLVVILNED